MRTRGIGLTIATVTMGLVCSCGSGASSAPTKSPTPLLTDPRHSADPVKGLDLHGVDWREATMPGSACFRKDSIRLHRGTAVWPGHRLSLATFNKQLFRYGDLEGGNTGDATVGLDCNNDGGMAGGALLYSVAVFSGRSGQPRLLELLTPRVQPKGELPTLLDRVRITEGQITWREAFYGGHDGTCCPSGRATTVWTYAAGRFTARTTVTRHPQPA